MPTEIYILVIVVCSCVILLTALTIMTAVYLKLKIDVMEKNSTLIKSDLIEMIHESRAVIKDIHQVTLRLAQPMDDLEQITHTARGWMVRSDRVIEAIGTVAEPPLYLISNKTDLKNIN